MTAEEFEELDPPITKEELNALDSDIYNVEDLVFDIKNRNFDGDTEAYRYVEIAKMSCVNGQIKQAREQCKRFGLDFRTIYRAAGRG